MFNFRHKIFLIILFIITLIGIFFYMRFTYDWYGKKQEYYLLLRKTNNIPFNLLKADLEKIFSLVDLAKDNDIRNHLDHEAITLSIIKNYSIRTLDSRPQSEALELTTSKDILDIRCGSTTLVIDLFSLKTLLSQLIPDYISYNIVLNNQLIISNGEASNIKIKANNKLPAAIMLTTELSINRAFLIKARINLIIASLIDYIATTIPCILISLFLYRKINYKLSQELQNLNKKFSKAQHASELLEYKIAKEKEYTLMMTQKINNQAKNALLVKLTGEDKHGKTNAHFITFPLAIIDKTTSVINIKKLLADLVSFFEYNLEQKQIALKINADIEKVAINASEEALYQIIYSLIFNVLNLIPDNTSVTIYASYDRVFKFALEYVGFNLSETQMLNYTSRYPTEIFLLNLTEVFDHLKLYDFSYSIKKDILTNSIRLEICSNIILKEEEKKKIFKLKDYIKK